jgi:hypothetical protein
LDLTFNDPEQDPVKLFYPNYVKAALPWPKAYIYAYRYEKGEEISVSLDSPKELMDQLEDQREAILQELPDGTEYSDYGSKEYSQFRTMKRYS